MPTRNTGLTAQDTVTDAMVRTGTYQNASEEVRDAIRLPRQRCPEETAKPGSLHIQIQAGLDDLEQGEFIEVSDSDLNHFLEDLAARAREAAR